MKNVRHSVLQRRLLEFGWYFTEKKNILVHVKKFPKKLYKNALFDVISFYIICLKIVH